MKSYSPAEEDLARNIKRGRKGVHIVYFPSFKNSRVIVCESKLEAEFCQLLEFDPQVISYTPQPITISIWVNGVLTDYTPDFNVNYILKPDSYFEVKPSTVSSWDEYMVLMKHAKQHFAEKKQEFELVVDTDIRKEPFLGNLKFLYSKIHRVSLIEINYLINVMKRFGGEIGYDKLLELDNAPSLGALANAIYSRQIEIDLTKKFDQDTKLRLRQ